MDVLKAKSQATEFNMAGLHVLFLGRQLQLTFREKNKGKPYDAVIALSGGLDSTCLLAKVTQPRDALPPFNVLAVNFQYGSKHNEKEAVAFNRIADHYEVDTLSVDFFDLFAPMSVSSLMKGGEEVPEGHYEEESMRSTVVNGRNTLFASYLIGLAQSVEARHVILGIHAGDHFIYPDCRPSWRAYMDGVVQEVSEGKVRVEAPYVSLTKDMIVADGIHLKVPFAKTHTCYAPAGPYACGKCGSCQERLSAFAANGAEDPLPYVTRELIKKGL